jgi:hypothetical protein
MRTAYTSERFSKQKTRPDRPGFRFSFLVVRQRFGQKSAKTQQAGSLGRACASGLTHSVQTCVPQAFWAKIAQNGNCQNQDLQD